MELSISALLSNFADDKLVAPKVLEKKLIGDDPESVPESLRNLQIALDALEKVGILAKERGKYRRLPEEDVVEGRLRCSSKGFCFAIQDGEETEDIYVRESQLNTAWNGDRVLVKVTKEGRRRRSPEGEVRLILERSNPSVLARVKQTETGFWAVPLDDRLLFEIQLQSIEGSPALEAAVDQLVHVEVIRYPLGQHPPLGKITQILGGDAQSAADQDLVCCKYDLPRVFPANVLQAAEQVPTQVRKPDLKKRLDLREQLTLSLCHPQQPTADLAYTLTRTPDEQWQLGVHTVDLSFVISPDSVLDREALKRVTTLYLGETQLPLFPETVTEQSGALAVGAERLTISVLITLNDAGEVLEFEIQPSVIQVDHQLDYSQAQALLNAPAEDTLPEDLQAERPVWGLLQQLAQLGQALQQQRQQRGSFELSFSEPERHVYPDEGLLGTVAVAPNWPIRTWVEELAILANALVGSHLQALGVPVMYRLQPLPELYEVQEFIKLANNLGLALELSQGETVQPQDYQSFVAQFANSPDQRILTQLLQATLKPACYSLSPGPHFGLALQQGYAHFVTPGRRYADLWTHRALRAVFEEGRDRRTTRAKERVNLRHSSCQGQISWNVLPPEAQRDLETRLGELVNSLNEREKIIQQASRDLDGLRKTKQMQDRTGDVFQGLITGVQSYGFFVVIEDILVEGLVHVSSLKDDWYEYRSRQQTLIGRKSRRQYSLGDRVEVQVKSVDYYRQQIDLVVVGGGSQASSEDLAEPTSEDNAEPLTEDSEDFYETEED